MGITQITPARKDKDNSEGDPRIMIRGGQPVHHPQLSPHKPPGAVATWQESDSGQGVTAHKEPLATNHRTLDQCHLSILHHVTHPVFAQQLVSSKQADAEKSSGHKKSAHHPVCGTAVEEV